MDALLKDLKNICNAPENKDSDKKIIQLTNEKKVILSLLRKELIGTLKGEKNISQATYEAATSPKGVIIKYQQLLISQARKYLRAKYPEAVSVDGMVFGKQA